MRVVIDDRRPSSEAAVVAVARTPANGRGPTTEPPTVPQTSETPPRLADRRPARGSVEAPYTIDDFPVRVVRSMHEAARSYRARLSHEIELRRVAILSAIREQRRVDVVQAREEAAQSRRAVDAWAATAQRQIKSERQRRKVEVEVELRRTLREKNQQVDRRVIEIEAAFAAHRAAIDGFFDGIEQERDPVAVAERAHRTPAFPDPDQTATTSPPTPDRPRVRRPEKPAWVQVELFELESAVQPEAKRQRE
jgi:hypothetical protein